MRSIIGKIVRSVDNCDHIRFFNLLSLPLVIAPYFFGSFQKVIAKVLRWQRPCESSKAGMKLLTIDMISVIKKELRVYVAVDVVSLVEGKNNYKCKGNPRQDCSD